MISKNLSIESVFESQIASVLNTQDTIAIRLSGGSDSALLAYLILTKFPRIKILPVTFYNFLRPSAKYSVAKILKFLNELAPQRILNQETAEFDTTTYSRDRGDVNPKDILQKKFIREMFKKYPSIKYVFSAETLNPSIEEQERILEGQPNYFMLSRNVKVASLISAYTDYSVSEVSPFRNFNKKEVSSLYREAKLLDSLYLLTESCESVKDRYNVMSKKFGIVYSNPGVEPCRFCWPCLERVWAYGAFDFEKPLFKD
jgi:tRNA(Ile)-lysidine synthase TilS/MesJ